MDRASTSRGTGTRIFLLAPRLVGLASVPWFRWGDGLDWGPSLAGGLMMWFLAWCLACMAAAALSALARILR